MQNRLSVITFIMEIIFLFPFWILNRTYINLNLKVNLLFVFISSLTIFDTPL